MQHTPQDPRPQDSDPAAGGSRARRSAAALAALAVFGASGTPAAHAVGQPEGSAPDERPEAVDGPARTVQPGDSIWSVATANGLSVEDLMEWNGLSGDASLAPGDTLRLTAPEKEASSSKVDGSPASGDEATRVQDPAAPPAAAKSAPSSAEHRVAAGESLWAIAQRHDVSVQALIEANDLDVAAPLREGEVLKVPAAETASEAEDAAAPAAAPAAASKTAETAEAPRIRDDFPGYDYDDETLASAQSHLDQLYQRPSPSTEEMQRLVRTTAQEMGVDPALALAHAEQESGFVHRSVSPADAVGTMQVLPSSGEWASALVGRDLDLLDPQDNVTAGVAIIRENQSSASDLERGIASYYQGAYGVEEYGMYDDTKTYVHEVKARISAWTHLR